MERWSEAAYGDDDSYEQDGEEDEYSVGGDAPATPVNKKTTHTGDRYAR